jgi:hypothetical protein
MISCHEASTPRRTTRGIGILVLVTGLMPAFLAAEEKLPAAEAIFDRLVEAMGGAEAFAKLENRLMSGSVELVTQGGIRIPFTIYQGRPTKSYMLMESDIIGKHESGTDGEVVWERSTMSGPQIKEGVERDVALHDATFDAIPNWRQYFEKVELVSVVEIDGTACYLLRLELKTGTEVTSYIDRETHLPVKIEIMFDLPAGKFLVENWPSDYREVDGIVMPYTYRTEVAGQVRVTRLEKIEHNVELPAGVFELPSDIRELLAGHPPAQGSGAEPSSGASHDSSLDDRPMLTDQERKRFMQEYQAPALVRDRTIEARYVMERMISYFKEHLAGD